MPLGHTQLARGNTIRNIITIATDIIMCIYNMTLYTVVRRLMSVEAAV